MRVASLERVVTPTAHLLVAVDGQLGACVHLPGDYHVKVWPQRPGLSEADLLRIGVKAVQENLGRLLGDAPESIRRAYCLALGGGWDE